jgi:Gpi18-like mannosyltransferase
VRRAPAAFVVLYLLLRGLMLLEPGYADDLAAYRRWAITAAQQGIAQVYRGSDMDYPPLYVYLLLPLGKAYQALSPGAGTPQGGEHAVWTALVKLPPLVFDLGVAALLFQAGARAEQRDEPARQRRWRWLLPGAYLANPAVVFDTGHWGHPDSIQGFFVLAAVVLVSAGRAAAGLGALALATLMKPLAAPLLPLLLALAWARSGGAAVLRGAAAALLVSLAVFAPFLAAGDSAFVVRRVVLDLDAMPYTSVNAHNLWGALGSWRRADAPLLGPLTATQIGLAAFAAVYLWVLALARRLRSPLGAVPEPDAGILAAAVAFSFFILSTHMHENHLFTALPLLVLALPLGARWRTMFVLVSLALFLNLALHDPALPGLWPLTVGGSTELPRPSHGRTYFVAELWAVRAATAFNLAVYVAFLLALRRRQPSACTGMAATP